MRLNLGCGWDKRKGYVNIDFREQVKPDVVHDLNKALPFYNDSCSEIIAFHVIEHLHDRMTFIEECNRVLKPGGKLFLRAPHISQIDSLGELDHKSIGLGVHSFVFLRPSGKRCYYSFARFEDVSVKLVVHPFLQFFADLSPIKYETYLSRFFGAREISFELRKA